MATLFGTKNGDSLAGTAGGDLIYGRGGDDTINGDPNDQWRFGDSDQLFGGRGNDTFLFYSFYAEDNVDTIMDYSEGDRISLSGYVFNQINGSDYHLGHNAFRLGNEAVDADTRIIYQRSTGTLFYDPDGCGEGEKSAFAVVAGRPKLEAYDFIISA